ncbi:hypothetical protein D3C86_1675530 [compost metagenome]
MAVVAGGEHQDRQRRRIGAQQAADLQTIEAGQHQVEDHQVRRIEPRPLAHMIATTDHADGVAVALKIAGDQFGEGGVVFDQEDVGHGCFQKVQWRRSGPYRWQASSHRV